MVAPWYTDPIWQNMLLFPWMDEEALLLSEVYTEMEMEEYTGRDRKRVATPLNDYKDLFLKVKCEGTRILVRGDPGIGKTTFVQKLAYDSAIGCLDLFDVVLVAKLKFADKNQSIASMIKEQIKSLWDNDAVTEKLIDEYMKSGRDRVLLVLDGLDEINMEHFPEVKDVLTGQAYRKCCILATTRPYVAETLYNKMTSVAKIKGFSREQAEKFIGNLLEDVEREEFLRQLDRRKMSQMHKVPLLVQAMALLYREKYTLPRTYTITYDELVFFIRKSCKKSKDLSEDELHEAMDEVNELAFKGLTRDDKQLVFSRDEVKNSNVYKLGILTAEKAGSGFRPTEILQFPHKTVQEHSAADHVVKKLLRNDRGPWETIVDQFHKDAAARNNLAEEEESKTRSGVESNEDATHTSEGHNKITILKRGIQKILNVPVTDPDIQKGFIKLIRESLEAGTFDGEVKVEKVEKILKDRDTILTKEEQRALLDFTLKEYLMQTPKEWRAHEKKWLQILLRRDKRDQTAIPQYMLQLRSILYWIQEDPETAKEVLLKLADFFKNPQPGTADTEFHTRQPYQYISQDFHQLLNFIEYNKTLFRFIIGKLSNNIPLRDTILLEIAVLNIQYSFDANSGGVLPFYELLSFANDVKMESLTKDEDSDPFVPPALVHLTSTMTSSNLTHLDSGTPAALYVVNKDDPGQDIQDFLNTVIENHETSR